MISTNTIRRQLRRTFGPRSYRITAKGEIHVLGQMPKTNVTGWYLFGWVGDPETKDRIMSM